jgi:hypothetical protein
MSIANAFANDPCSRTSFDRLVREFLKLSSNGRSSANQTNHLDFLIRLTGCRDNNLRQVKMADTLPNWEIILVRKFRDDRLRSTSPRFSEG